MFFIDESQRVTLNDIGSVEEIEKWAKMYGAEITHMELISQFRCNGSDGYLAWLDNALFYNHFFTFSIQSRKSVI